jgi:hypothetical protein
MKGTLTSLMKHAFWPSHLTVHGSEENFLKNNQWLLFFNSFNLFFSNSTASGFMVWDFILKQRGAQPACTPFITSSIARCVERNLA